MGSQARHQVARSRLPFIASWLMIGLPPMIDSEDSDRKASMSYTGQFPQS